MQSSLRRPDAAAPSTRRTYMEPARSGSLARRPSAGRSSNARGLKMNTTGVVTAVSRSSGHTFSKQKEQKIRLIAGLGVEGDAHAGATVKHRSRVAVDPTQPNLRQVHLI